jgi:hypothetical protein
MKIDTSEGGTNDSNSIKKNDDIDSNPVRPAQSPLVQPSTQTPRPPVGDIILRALATQADQSNAQRNLLLNLTRRLSGIEKDVSVLRSSFLNELRDLKNDLRYLAHITGQHLPPKPHNPQPSSSQKDPEGGSEVSNKRKGNDESGGAANASRVQNTTTGPTIEERELVTIEAIQSLPSSLMENPTSKKLKEDPKDISKGK